MAKSSFRPAIRDSFDEEDVSDDVDDEVFIRDGRNGYKIDEENGLKKPLMPPRRRMKHAKFTPSANQGQEPVRTRCKAFLAPCCFGVAALSVLLGSIAITIVVINLFSQPLSRFQLWIGKNSHTSEKTLVPCVDLAVTDVWVQTFPKLTSETAVRLNDINNDGILDVVLGYGTGTDGRNVPEFVCTLYFGRDPPCLGGIVALNGKDGKILWQHWTRRPVFSVDCGADLTKDGVNDCLIGGKGGLLQVVNGHDGSLLWHLEDELEQKEAQVILNVYSAQYIPDIDNDGFTDIISAHTVSESSGTSVKGHLILISGKAGHILRMIEMPGGSESYYAPQLLVRPDGETVILIGTGGTAGHSWGGLHAIPINQLAGNDKVLFNTLVTSDSRGVISPPVLVDINNDGTEDIIVSLFNSTIVAIDGKNFSSLWNYTFDNSQTFSSPTPGYFNNDDVPDLLVKYQNGPDFPVYFFSEMNILDGKTGMPLLDHSVIDSVGSQMGGLSISMEGLGNDWLLYWTANCASHEGSQTPFSFAKGSSIVAQSQADLCHLRFNSTMTATLWAINRHIDAPGFPLYSSDKRKALEFNNSKDALDEASRYLATHPDFWVRFGLQENTMKSSNVDDFQTGEAKSVSKHPLYMNNVFKDDPSQGVVPISGVRGKSGEAEEIEEADYSPMQAHHIGKHHRPLNALGDSRDLSPSAALKNYGSMYEPRISDEIDQDYESSALSRLDASHIGNDFNSFLTNNGNRQEKIPQTSFNFPKIFHGQQQSGRRFRKSIDSNSRNDDKRKSIRKTRKTKFKRKVVGKSDSAKNTEKSSRKISPDSSSGTTTSGIYPITSIGTLAPPLSGSGIDLIVVSYWIPPSDGVQILTPKDSECLKLGMARASNDENEKYSNMDQETLEMALTAECLFQRFSSSPHDMVSLNDGRLEPHPGFVPKSAAASPPTYDALNLQLGQLTVYRLNVQCKCHSSKPDHERCARILPFEEQSWPSYMGRDGRGYFNPR